MAHFLFFPQSEVQEISGFTEDGDRPVIEVWYVYAEATDGTRFVLKHSWVQKSWKSEEGFVMVGSDSDRQNELQAIAMATKIQKAFNGGRDLDPDCWVEVDPCYGSEAWVRQDAGGYFAYMEKRREEDRA